jgi:AcrR family transcriptional regulator
MEASATSKSQLYHYFADKDALVREVITLQTGRVLAAQSPDLEQLDSLAGLRRWRDAVVGIVGANSGAGGCPIGSLASELADQSDRARKHLVRSFQTWESYIVKGLQAMRDRGELAPKSDPRDLATAVMSAIQGGILLAQTTRTTRPLELALDMALEHIAHHLRGKAPP